MFCNRNCIRCAVESVRIIIAIFIVGLVLNMYPIYTDAEELGPHKINLDDIGISMDIPSSFLFRFTRQTKENDIMLRMAGVTLEQLLNMMETTDCYFYAAGLREYMKVYMTEADYDALDYRAMSNEEVLAEHETTLQYLSSEGVVITSTEVYANEQAKYIKILCNENSNELQTTSYTCLYFTAYEGKFFTVEFVSLEDDISEYEKRQFQDAVDSVKFSEDSNEEMTTPIPADSLTGSIYKDSETGLVFTVPYNWSEKDFYTDNSFFEVKLVSNSANRAIILYGSADMWGAMSSGEKAQYGVSSRDELNNFAFTA